MGNISVVVSRFVFFLVLAATATIAASAQTTIINTPSTDTLQAKMFYIEFDFAAKLKPYRDGGFQTYGYRTVYGLNRKTEAGVSLFYTRAGSVRPIEGQFSIKRKLYTNERRGVAWATGATAYVPLRNSGGNRSVATAFTTVSKKVKRANGLRLTAGAYQVFNGGQNFGTKTGATLAFEQPLINRVTFVGDWSTGRNRFGYAAAGLAFAITKKQSVTVSYNFSNAGKGDNFLYMFYSYYF